MVSYCIIRDVGCAHTVPRPTACIMPSVGCAHMHTVQMCTAHYISVHEAACVCATLNNYVCSLQRSLRNNELYAAYSIVACTLCTVC